MATVTLPAELIHAGDIITRATRVIHVTGNHPLGISTRRITGEHNGHTVHVEVSPGDPITLTGHKEWT